MQYLFCDVEASGLFDYTKAAHETGQPRLAQIGMIFVGDDAEIQSQHEFTIRPRGWMMSPEAIESTGLTTEYLEEHGGPIDEALDLYSRAIEGRRIITGWNVKNYDLKVMRGELRRASRDDLFLKTRSMELMHPCRPIVKALNKLGRIKQPRLEEACEHFGIDHGGHRALADAMSTYHIWRKLIELEIVPEISDPYDPKPKKTGAKRVKKSKANDDNAGEVGDFPE